MLQAHRRAGYREVAASRGKGGPYLLTLSVDSDEHPHHRFVEPEDRLQTLYERARSALGDRRVRSPDSVQHALQAHGLAGLFLNPERTLVSPPCRHSPSDSRKGTALHHTRLPEDLFETIARSLTEGVGIRATARILRVNKKTVVRVLTRAADQASRVSRALLRGVVVSECQLDEMWSFIRKKEANLEPLERLQAGLGDAWIWIAFDAEHKVVLAHVVGKRTEPHAVALLQEVKRVTAGMPTLFSSDQLDQYPTALARVYGRPVIPPRRPGPGRPPKPRLVPPEDLLYVQVVKDYKENRVASITRRVVFGDPRKVEEVLRRSPLSRTINTSYVERNNATVRHLDARCSRRTYRFSKQMRNHKLQLALSFSYYHLCLPHAGLTKRYQRPTSPFMSAGLTDHVWTMGELLKHQATRTPPRDGPGPGLEGERGMRGTGE